MFLQDTLGLIPDRNSLLGARRPLQHLIVNAIVAGLIFLTSDAVFGQAPDFSVPKKKKSNPQVTQPPQKPGPAAGRPNRQPAKPSAKPSAGAQKNRRKKSETPTPENMTLTTKDSVQLQCTWFPAFGGTDKAGEERDGKTIAPFILLHDWDGSRQDLLLLGRFLQLRGHSSIVPDLRGHGESLKVTGVDDPLDRAKFRKQDIPLMAKDIEQCKRFLMTKNNAGELNIDMLSIVTVGQTSALAVPWVISDWGWPPLGSIKQGQDVKALVMISPRKRFKSMNLTRMLAHPLFAGTAAPAFPVLMVYASGNTESVGEADSIFETLQKARGKNTDAQASKIQRLVRSAVPGTSASGSKLVSDAGSQGMFAFIDRFVEQAVISEAEKYEWQEREN